MKVLAIDTSTSMAGVAVADENGLLGEYSLNDKKTHSQKLVPMIDELLRSLKLSAGDIDVFAAITGPGSFTGIRIGVTTVKAMAYAGKKPAVGVTSLDALAEAVPAFDDVLVCPMLDARNNQVYTAIYKRKNGVMTNLSGYMGIHVSELAKKLEEKNADVIFTGDGVILHEDFLKIQLADKCSFMPVAALQRMAASAASIAVSRALKGETLTSFELEPFYLRQSQAEREFDRKSSNE
jgi:tRNA threonylcarbamoyladenosine biosynthesis protein TsaB